jgi:small subunit ribosomal protein S2
MAVVTMKQLLGAGVHFGHQTRRWNPKMRRFILGERNGIYLIDLRQTMKGIEESYGYIRDLVAGGGTILFVGTKKQTQGPVAIYAEACGMPYVNERWLGGMLTNFQTVSTRVKRMKEFEAMQKAGDFEAMPKKEALRHTRELEKLQRNLGGIRGLERLPDAIFVIDTKKEHIAVTEANKLGLPVVAVVDTNCDPDVITHVIPGNDDAIRSGALLCRVVADAVVEGRFIAQQRPTPPAASTGAPTPTPPASPAPPTAVAAPEADGAAATGSPNGSELVTASVAPATDAGAVTAPAPTVAAPAPAPEAAAEPAPPAAEATATASPAAPTATEQTAAEATATASPAAPTAAEPPAAEATATASPAAPTAAEPRATEPTAAEPTAAEPTPTPTEEGQ